MNRKLKRSNKKQIIKIPNNTKVFWHKKKKIIIIKGSSGQKILKIHELIAVCCRNQTIELMGNILNKLSNHEKKKSYSIQKTTASLLKQLLIETTVTIYQKLKLVGVGYKAFSVQNFETRLLLLQIGYSHNVYLKIFSNTNVFCLKFTKVFVYGYSYEQVRSMASKIRACKIPEPYKSKGILYENEKITLKEGKKI